MSVRELLAATDAQFVVAMGDLSDDEWAAPSLCTEWTNHEVLAHLVIGRNMRLTALAAEIVRHGASFDRAAAAMATTLAAARPPIALLNDFADRPRGTGRYFPRTLFLGDLVTHELDILLALDRDPSIGSAALIAVLNAQVHLPNPFVPAFRNSRGLKLVATDVGWVHGSGPAVVGSAPDLISVLGHRPKALPRLSGDGVEFLAKRVGSLSCPSRTAG